LLTLLTCHLLRQCANSFLKKVENMFRYVCYHDSYRWQTEEVPCYRVANQRSFDWRKHSTELEN
jgi:saccharopine dehydrogenase-like NADP-dependent oxidoreductase